MVILHRVKFVPNPISSPDEICSSPSANEANDEITPIITTQNNSFEANAPHNQIKHQQKHITEEIQCETPNDNFAGRFSLIIILLLHTLVQTKQTFFFLYIYM